MGYASGWNDGLSFNNLGRAIGLKGIKPMLDHAGDSIGLNGFDKAGKAHGTNALGGLLVLGGAQAASGFGGMGGSGGVGGAGSSATGGMGGFFESLMGGGQSLTGGAPGFSGGQAAAPIVDASSAASPQTVQGLGSAGGSAGGATDWLSKAGKLSQIGGQTGLLGGGQQEPIQPGQLPQTVDLAGLLSLGGLDEMQQKRLARRGLLEGGYGAA